VVLLGVNCRDLQTLEVLPQRFTELSKLLPRGFVRVAESGITTPDECADVARSGYELALVGSVLMTAQDPAGVIRTMLAAGRAAA
jgi:indole-3-glycerol phosphate synthase